MVGWKNGKINTTSHKKNVAGEEGDASEFTVSSWTERVKELTLNYAPQDVWNMDESGAFWKALPERSLTEKKVMPGRKTGETMGNLLSSLMQPAKRNH